jgi:hypothetical protein
VHFRPDFPVGLKMRKVRVEAFNMTDNRDAENPKPAPTAPAKAPPDKPKEIGGPKGPEPTRFGDWERKGRVSDF